ncbi:MAG TPA: hypothetical protein VFS43_24860 [Polyangiaceae bacterium]|nr:hypothetical protein [Polyangiaceae bacterium]
MNELVAALFDATPRGEREGWSLLQGARAPFSPGCERSPPP